MVCLFVCCCCFVGRGVVQGWEDALVSKCALLSVTDLWYLLLLSGLHREALSEVSLRMK